MFTIPLHCIGGDSNDWHALATMTAACQLPGTDLASRLPSIFERHFAIHEDAQVRRLSCLLHRLDSVHCEMDVETFPLDDPL